MAATSEEEILPLRVPRSQVPPVVRVRALWLMSSLRAARERGRMDAYLASLPPAYHDVVRSTPVSQWLPAAVAVAHYEAMDSLELSTSEILETGESVLRHGFGRAIEIVLKLARLTPPELFARSDNVWTRAFDGGAIHVLKLGPKELRIDTIGLPFSHLRYPRIAIRGVLAGVAAPAVKKVHVNEMPEHCVDGALSYRMSWL